MGIAQNEREQGINANILVQDGNIRGIEVNGYVGKGATREAISQLARDFERSVGDIIQKLEVNT